MEEGSSSTCGPSHETYWSRCLILHLRFGSRHSTWAEIEPLAVCRKVRFPTTTPRGPRGSRAANTRHIMVARRGVRLETHVTRKVYMCVSGLLFRVRDTDSKSDHDPSM